MKKTILISTNIPAPYRMDLYNHIKKRMNEYDIHILFSAEGEDNRKWHIDRNVLKNTHFLKSRTIKIKKKYDTHYIYFPVGVGKMLKEINPDIVIGWEYNPVSVRVITWCKMHRRKYISLTDGTLHSERNINFIQKLNREYIISNCDAAIASSTKAKEKLLAWKIDPNKIFISLLTTNVLPYISATRTPISGRILYVGSLIERKGLDLLIAALKYVKYEYELRIVGDGTEKEIREIKGLISREKLSGYVSFCGYKEGGSLVDEYMKAKIFVFPTREDCFGLVLVEALAARVPIITSKYADGAYDIIVEGRNGVIVDPYDEKNFGEIIERELNADNRELDNSELISKFMFQEVIKGYEAAIHYVS